MDFTPNDEQRMIADSFAKVFADGDGWDALADLGLLSATYPEGMGGIGAGLGDLVYALIEAGRAATTAPLIGAAILPGLALSRAGAAAPAVGAATLALSADTDDLTVSDNSLSGTVQVVPGADVARAVLLCLPDDRLAVVACDGAGMQRDIYALVDGRGAADLRLSGAQAMIGAPVPGLRDWLRDVAATAYAADALGAMLALRDMTLAYLKERKQFGRPLGSFQALQHAMVDIHHDTEHFLSLTHLAVRMCDGDDAAARMRMVSGLKRFLGGRMRRAGASAIQLHGGIGVTQEYALGGYVKRVLLADMLNGSSETHAARLAGIIACETQDITKKEAAA